MYFMLVEIMVLIVAALHIGFALLEIVLWQKPYGRKTFKLTEEFARQSAPLAANQGLYNLFLSAGLFWSVWAGDPSQAFHLKIFFLSCVLMAGIFGAVTVSYRILFIQGMPAALALGLLLF